MVLEGRGNGQWTVGTGGWSDGSKTQPLVGDVPVYEANYEERAEAWGGVKKGDDNYIWII